MSQFRIAVRTKWVGGLALVGRSSQVTGNFLRFISLTARSPATKGLPRRISIATDHMQAAFRSAVIHLSASRDPRFRIIKLPEREARYGFKALAARQAAES